MFYSIADALNKYNKSDSDDKIMNLNRFCFSI